jgi:HSP20 family protein
MMTNNVTRWTPSQQQAAIAREPFYRLFDTYFSDAAGEELATRAWTPPVDIQETDDAYQIQAELPGMKKEDIQITLENNILRVSGERKWEKDVKKENYHRIERSYGTFTRSFALPNQVSADKVQAKFDSGVLSITVPKAEVAKPRRIEIGAS